MAVPVRTYGDGILIITGDYVRGQDAVAASGLSGSSLNLSGGAGDGVGDGGGVLIDGGVAGASANASGGSVTIQGTNSAATGTGNGGSVVLIPGLAQGTGTDGFVHIDAGSADFSPLLRFDNSAGVNGVITDILVGSRDPTSAAISALRGSLYIRNPGGGTAGSLWVNTSVTDPGTTWTDVTAGGGSSWSAVLAAGATSGGTSPIISVGDSLIGVDTAGSNAGDYTIRAGNHTAGSGSFTGGDLTVSGGSNVSSSSAARGGNLILTAGDNLVAAGATGGDLTCRAGAGVIGGAAVFAAGESIAGSAAGTATFQGGDNTATGAGGHAIVRGGDCVAGSGSDSGGNLTMRAGQARGTQVPGIVTIQGGQPDDGGSGSRTGTIFINTSITASGTNRQTGAIEIMTGDASTTSTIGVSGDLDLGTGTATSGGISGNVTIFTGNANTDSGDITILTGTSTASVTGSITLQTGNTASGSASDPAGDINFITGNRTNTGSDANSRAGNVNFTLGTSSNPNTTGPGGSFIVTAGPSNATSANGRGGSVTIVGGAYSGGTAAGLAGSVSITGGSSTGASGDAGGVSILGGAPTGNNSAAGGVTITGGAGDAAGTASAGGDVSLFGGAGGSSGAGGSIAINAGDAGASNSNGGSVTITAKGRTGVGSDGRIALQATRSGTTDDAVISIDTENGSFAGSEWNHMTVGVEALTTTGTATILAIGGPSTDGQNVKLRVWATASQTGTPAAQLSQILERSFKRVSGSTTAFTADHQNSIINDGGWGVADVVGTSISGSTINVQITAPSGSNSNWMLIVEWQRGGMAA